jgi:hypothetical protein
VNRELTPARNRSSASTLFTHPSLAVLANRHLLL